MNILADLLYAECIMCIYSHTHKRVYANLANRKAVDEANKLKKKMKLLQESLEKERAEKVRHCTQLHS